MHRTQSDTSPSSGAPVHPSPTERAPLARGPARRQAAYQQPRARPREEKAAAAARTSGAPEGRLRRPSPGRQPGRCTEDLGATCRPAATHASPYQNMSLLFFALNLLRRFSSDVKLCCVAVQHGRPLWNSPNSACTTRVLTCVSNQMCLPGFSGGRRIPARESRKEDSPFEDPRAGISVLCGCATLTAGRNFPPRRWAQHSCTTLAPSPPVVICFNLFQTKKQVVSSSFLLLYCRCFLRLRSTDGRRRGAPAPPRRGRRWCVFLPAFPPSARSASSDYD